MIIKVNQVGEKEPTRVTTKEVIVSISRRGRNPETIRKLRGNFIAQSGGGEPIIGSQARCIEYFRTGWGCISVLYIFS